MIQSFADWLVYGIFGLDSATKLGQAVNFFFYDSLKILILLFLISAVMGVINAYFPIDRLRNFLQSTNSTGWTTCWRRCSVPSRHSARARAFRFSSVSSKVAFLWG